MSGNTGASLLILAKPKPISDGGSPSGITYLRRGRKYCGEMAVERKK